MKTSTVQYLNAPLTPALSQRERESVVHLWLAFALVLLLCLVSCEPARAQDVPTNQPPAAFLTTVGNWFTTQNTNLLTFQQSHGDVWAGADYRDGLNSSYSFGVNAKIWKSLSLDTVMHNASIAGTVVSIQGGLGLGLVSHDMKFTPYADLGYDLNLSQAFVALGARVQKALTEHTFVGLGMEVQLATNGKAMYGDNMVPVLTFLTGFTF